MILYLSDEKELNQDQRSYILYFYADWIPKSIGTQCKKMVTKISEEMNILTILIDTDYFKSITKRYEVQRVPTYLFIIDNIVVKKNEGYMLTTAYRSLVREFFETKGQVS